MASIASAVNLRTRNKKSEKSIPSQLGPSMSDSYESYEEEDEWEVSGHISVRKYFFSLFVFASAVSPPSLD